MRRQRLMLASAGRGRAELLIRNWLHHFLLWLNMGRKMLLLLLLLPLLLLLLRVPQESALTPRKTLYGETNG